MSGIWGLAALVASHRKSSGFVCGRGTQPTGNAYDELTSNPSAFGVGTFTLTAVPEASTWAMMLLGFAGLGYAGYRRVRAPRAAQERQQKVVPSAKKGPAREDSNGAAAR